ncbi:hydroxyethylthiazole kinase [Sediminispirochaeta smaragdinae]|uniref:Hydroxyethylthiazole kinase n=1 Tax=Sediminispirochaeta smaragdinae (strain DSM 11293 / JCM 15392 / SEBR 4228) TaxID=573413 RepID=E1RC15_SEDSS|nr:hydroxyethylthiazole kinase [Sediminispirochaeta smaragdinae]ADK79895.1 Hydroxyethylthiazole kinase [Sediminispirochaeta smaragdinae DSM 11293]
MEFKGLNTAFHDIRNASPLIHHITNMVTINDCANITLAFGGAPVMTDWKEDALDMVEHAGALVLNMGTLNPDSIEAMLAAGGRARELGIPIVFDPVGAGATAPRRKAARQILEGLRPDIVKGNAAEIAFLAGRKVRQKGVDSTLEEGVRESVSSLASAFGITVIATGREDIISDGSNTLQIRGGSAMMGRITGTGCMSASALGCFVSVLPSKLEAAAGAILAMNLAGETAARALAAEEGSGSFRIRLIDAASRMDDSTFFHPERINHV